jgi:myo-inositol-1(or 4)-monophosphatase
MTQQELIKETIKITQEAGQAIMSFYRDSFSVKDKTPDNPVTDADLAADALLHRRLGALLPEAGWLSEETADSAERLDQRLVWVVDPLDGTKEFVMGIPEFSVSVALVEDGQPRQAVIFNPPTGELFHAVRGQGAFLDGRPVTVSPRSELAGAQVDASRSERKRGEFEPFESMLKLRTMGSIAYKLARVAAGQVDATWSRGPKSEWDICAGTLLIEEAGGRCVDLDGQPMRFNKSFPKVNGIIATNDLLYEPVISLLAPHRDTARTDYQ